MLRLGCASDGGRPGAPILNFALFAKFGVGMLEADPNQQRPPVHCPVCVAYHCDFQFSIVISSAAGSSANALPNSVIPNSGCVIPTGTDHRKAMICGVESVP